MSAPTPRWTPSRIRKATPFPKPRTEISRVELALYAANMDLDWILKHIAGHADVIHDGRSLNNERDFTFDRASVLPTYQPPGVGFEHRGDWLLVPVSPAILEALAEIGSAVEDFESSGDDEPDHDGEPSLAVSERVDQSQFESGGYYDGDLELDDCDDEDGGDYEPAAEGEAASRPRLPVTPAADVEERR